MLRKYALQIDTHCVLTQYVKLMCKACHLLTVSMIFGSSNEWLIAFLIHTPPMEDIHFLDPLPWNSADVDEFPSYPLEFHDFLQISSLPHGISTDL
jgi:hypothetical protein